MKRRMWMGLLIALMCLMVFAGASQIMAAGMLIQGAELAAIIIATFLLNLRHIIMSTCVFEKMEPSARAPHLLGAYWVTDESFAMFTTGTEKNKAALLERLAEEKQKPIREVEISILKQRGGRSSGIVRFAYDARHNAYSQCQQVEDYLTSNFKDLNEQREHRARLTGHAISPEDCPPVTHYTTRKKPL